MPDTTSVLERLPSFLVPFFTLSYPTETPKKPDSFPDSRYYHDGRLDVCLLITTIAAMAILRDVIRLWLAEPFARWKLKRDIRKAQGHKLEMGEKTPLLRTNITVNEERILNHNVLRFAEQSWSLVYYSLNLSFGLYVHYKLPTSISDMSHLWINYPHSPLAGPVKLYYITQTAFYTHQILVLNAEARRKDHWQMMLHHIIAVALMIISYYYYWTRIGCLIMVIMDWCDLWFCIAKMLRYLNFSTICDMLFVFFMVSWLVTRHILFNLVIVSAVRDSRRLLSFDWNPAGGYYFTEDVYNACVVLLIALQILQIVWFFMICRVAYRVLKGEGAEDTRSDDEEEEEKKER